MVLGVPEAWRQCYSSSMNSGKIVGDGTGRVDGQKMEGSTRGPRGPKKSHIGWHERHTGQEAAWDYLGH